jgi:ATP sulfurylase
VYACDKHTLVKHRMQLITPTHILAHIFDVANKQAVLQINKQNHSESHNLSTSTGIVRQKDELMKIGHVRVSNLLTRPEVARYLIQTTTELAALLGISIDEKARNG